MVFSTLRTRTDTKLVNNLYSFRCIWRRRSRRGYTTRRGRYEHCAARRIRKQRPARLATQAESRFVAGGRILLKSFVGTGVRGAGRPPTTRPTGWRRFAAGALWADAHLGFDSKSDGADIRNVGPRRIELGGDDWDLLLVFDGDGRVTSETQVVFDLVFEDRLRKVRCRPADPAVGTLNIVRLGESGELSGSFDIELVRCEHAETGTPLGWPPKPLILHGSFDRLPLDTDTE